MKDQPAVRPRQSGFTLIELMVVIGIISLLAAALLPQIVESTERAARTADKANLRWHFQTLTNYKGKYKRAPRVGGPQFVIDPWVKGTCERTLSNYQRYWTPGVEDAYKDDLLVDVGVDEVWKEIEDVGSADTHYAGRAKEHLRGKIWSGKQPLMANDNEYGAAFIDQTIHVLMGDGSVTELFLDPDLKDTGWEGDGKEEGFPVGPDSPIELLQKLQG